MMDFREQMNNRKRFLRRIVSIFLCMSLISASCAEIFADIIGPLGPGGYSDESESDGAYSRSEKFELMVNGLREIERSDDLAGWMHEMAEYYAGKGEDSFQKVSVTTDPEILEIYGKYALDFSTAAGLPSAINNNGLVLDITYYRDTPVAYFPLSLENFKMFLDEYLQITGDQWWKQLTLSQKAEIMSESIQLFPQDYLPDRFVDFLTLMVNPKVLIPDYDQYQGQFDPDSYIAVTVNATSAEVDYYRMLKDPEHAITPEEVKGGTYLLRADTGVLGGNNVLYFGIRYTDSDGVERTEFLFPHENSLNDGYSMAELYGSPVQRLNRVYAATDYSVSNSYGDSDGLKPYSSDMYLFRPGYDFQTLNEIDVFLRKPMNKDQGSKGWTCNGLYFYDVESLYGVDMSGFYSGSYNISFRGELLGYLEEDTVDFELEGSDIVYKIGNAAGTDYKLAAPSEEKRYYDSQSNEYLIKLDIADTLSAGIESLAAFYNDDYRLKQVVEALTIKLQYEDTNGRSRTVFMPAITSMVGWLVENDLISQTLPIAGLAQQGDNILFTANIPDFSKLLNFDLIYGDDAAPAAGVSATAGVTRATRLKGLVNDSMAITGAQIYGNDASVNYALNGASLKFSVNGNPLYYFVANDSNGKTIASGTTNVSMSPYREGAALKPNDKAGAEHYIVVITTDDMTQAGTKADLSLKVGYIYSDGKEYETNAISLREAAESFYGYWPCAEGQSAYPAAASPGMELIAELPITSANRFTSVTIAMDSRSTDDWQMKELAIYSVDELGNRKIVWNDPQPSDTAANNLRKITDRIITREFDRTQENLVARYPSLKDIAESEEEPDKLYLGGNIFVKTIYFGENSKSDINEKKIINWNEYRYSMSYKDTLQDLGFTNRDSLYQVDVKVASNSESTSKDGDTGSQNLFYFKLIFENGNSGYVLANQQLSADGFRADRTETFYIATNEDMGSLSAVSIIPEDNSGSDNQDVFDKLKISYIDVIKVSDEALSKSWRVDNVGWIDINYLDRGAEETSSGRPGRTEAELAQIKTVTSKGYSVNLLFVMNTGSYERGENDVNRSASRDNPQLVGSVVATIEYYDNSGILRKKSVDVVRAMYDYAGRTATNYGDSYKDEDGESVARAQSDESFMFRANHNDRFIVSLNDVNIISKIRFGVRSEVSTTWKMNKLSIYQITGSGNLQLTTADEYKRSNEVEWLCDSFSDDGYKLKVFMPDRQGEVIGEEQSLPVTFTQHKLNINMSGSKWSSTISKTPVNRNDTLNLYVFMKDDPIATPITDYELKGNVQWHSSNPDGDRADSIGFFNKDVANNMFYYNGLPVSGIDTIKSLTVAGSSRKIIMADLDHAIIQHVRSGVTIDNYYVDFEGASAEYTKESDCIPLTELETNAYDQFQTVSLLLDEDCPEMDILADKQDLAVSFSYKTDNDRYGSGSSYTYRTPYIFLSELTDKNNKLLYPTIKPGMVLQIPFSEPFVYEITDLSLVMVGDNSQISLDSAYISRKNASGSVIDWVSFDRGGEVDGTPFTAMPSENNVITPVKLVFTNLSDARIVSSGPDDGASAPIRMTLNYSNINSGGNESLVIDDIRKYLSSGDFAVTEEGNTATIQFFARNIGSIRSLRLEPYAKDPASSASWGIDAIYSEINCKGTMKQSSAVLSHEELISGVKTLRPGKTAAEGLPVTVNMSSVYEILTVSYYDDVLGITNKPKTDINGTIAISVPEATKFTITPNIVGTLDGYGFTTEMVQLMGAAQVPVNFGKTSGKSLIFDPPENESTEAVTYIVTCYSEEVPSVSASVQITIAGKEKEEIIIPIIDPAPAPVKPEIDDPEKGKDSPEENEPKPENGETEEKPNGSEKNKTEETPQKEEEKPAPEKSDAEPENSSSDESADDAPSDADSDSGN